MTTIRGPNGNPIYPFIQALHYQPVSPSKPRKIERIVLHSMEGGDTKRKARNTAEWMAGRSKDPAPIASFHFAVDPDEIIQVVREEDVAYHARGANHNSLGIELAGTAAQTEDQWRDEYSSAVMSRAIDLCVVMCKRWSIEPRILGVEDLLNGDGGITTHAAVSLAYRRSTHTDPGGGFPFVWFVMEVARRCAALAANKEVAG